MKRNISTKFVWTLSLIVMFIWLASNGCKGSTSDSPSAQIAVSSRQIAIGNVVLINISDQTVSIQNTGSISLTIGQIAQANPLAPPFSIVSDACSGQAVQPSASCIFKVQFSPTSQGTFTDSFDIPSDASNENSVTVDVTGSGISSQIIVSSRQIAYGNVILNNITDQTVSIQNAGSSGLTIGQIAQANPLTSPFSIVSDACSGQAVQPSASCSFKVRLIPTSQGTFTDSFDIPSDAVSENSVTVDVTGSGKAFRVAVNEVITDCSTGNFELIVNVNDQNNAPLTTLPAFQLNENGLPQTITTVSQLTTTVPISVAMLLDNTGSIQSQLPTIKIASIAFVGNLSPVDDEASIIKFGQFPVQMCPFTSSHAVLIDAINTDPTDTQIGIDGTYLYDALWFSVEKTAASSKHKAVVLVSDGRDENYLGVPNVSAKTLDEVIAYAAANNVTMYTVGMGNVDSVVMNRLASETGGQYYPITDVSQLDGVYQAISGILLGQYSIKYVSSLHGSIPINLEINVLGGTDAGVGVWQGVGCP